MKKVFAGTMILAITLVMGAFVPTSADPITWDTGYPGPEGTAPSFPQEVNSDINFYANSTVQSTDGTTGPFFYYWQIWNCSDTWEIQGWTWTNGSESGNVLEFGASDPDSFPLPVLDFSTDPYDAYYADSILVDEPSERIFVDSTVHLVNTSTQTIQTVDFRIYAPSALVPEPSAVAALASGLFGMLGLIRRRR